MSRSSFAQTIALFLGIVLKNRVQLAFLADGRRRARKAHDRETAAIHADLFAASLEWPE